jgi:hypothetical protein
LAFMFCQIHIYNFTKYSCVQIQHEKIMSPSSNDDVVKIQ